MQPPTDTLLSRTLATPDTAPHLEWHDALGLWGRPSPGHTRPVSALPRVHSGVESAVLLHALLELDLLDDATLASALTGLLDLQTLSGPLGGCFRWYAEETEPTDTNAAFFIGLALQLLALDRPDRIPAELRPRLDHAFALLNDWFLAELGRESPVYPNKYLGDIVCAWLGHELLNQTAPATLVDATRSAFAYWEATSWGWGEHLSDVYSGVLLTEFAALLLFARRLPADLRDHAQRLARDLLALDDACGPGPRVPQIRCYDFNHASPRLPFRAQIVPYPPEADAAWAAARALKRYMLQPFGPLFARHGWTTRFPSPPPPSGALTLRVPLADGAFANACIAPGLRTGSLSRWPILPDAENQRWGLSWQTFPAAFWRPAGDWGFLRCTTRRGDDVRAHPALEKSRAYLFNTLGPGEPPPLMRTAAHQHGASWLVLRALDPCPAAGWHEVRDGFWLHDLAAPPQLEFASDCACSLLLPHSEGALRLRHFPLDPASRPTLDRIGPAAWSWTAPADSPALWCLEPADHTSPGTPDFQLKDRIAHVSWPGTRWDGLRLGLPVVS